jgi:hypothetical protein
MGGETDGLKDVILSFRQEPNPEGFINIIDIRHDEFGSVGANEFSVYFQHVGVEFLPKPTVLDGYLFGFLLFAMSGGGVG